MDQFTFDSFIVNSENRHAVELCVAVSRLQPVMPQPLFIVGESGTGKTHLLCALINYLQENAPNASLVYVTAKDFPASARALAEDARPISRRPAVLLVDQLERFTPEFLDLLNRVAPLFVGKNRWLVVAARTEVENLAGLPAGLRSLLESGQTVPLRNGTRAAHTESENALLRSELEETLAEQRILKQEVRSLQRALEEIRRQRDLCQAESSALAAANAELERLKQIVAEPAIAEPVTMDRAGEEEIQQAQQLARDAEAEMGRWAMRAQAILQQVELNRARFAENSEVQLQQVLALRQRTLDLSQGVEEMTGGLEETEPAEKIDSAADITRQLDEIAEAATNLPADSQLPAAETESRIQTLYAQLLRAAQAIQELSDRVNDQAGESSTPVQPRPWYADPFPLPKKTADWKLETGGGGEVGR